MTQFKKILNFGIVKKEQAFAEISSFSKILQILFTVFIFYLLARYLLPQKWLYPKYIYFRYTQYKNSYTPSQEEPVHLIDLIYYLRRSQITTFSLNPCIMSWIVQLALFLWATPCFWCTFWLKGFSKMSLNVFENVISIYVSVRSSSFKVTKESLFICVCVRFSRFKVTN